jgi:hypothetical protein
MRDSATERQLTVGKMKVDYEQALRLFNEDHLSPAEIARQFGVHRSTITRVLRQLQGKIPEGMPSVVAAHKVARYADYQFGFVEQQNKDVKILNNLLDRIIRYINGDKTAFTPMQKKVESRSAEGGQEEKAKKGKEGASKKTKVEQKIETFDFSIDPRLLMVQVIREVREHMKLQLDALNMLANAQNVLAFQRHVLDVIGEIEPGAREKIVNRLRSEHAIRASLIISKPEQKDGLQN